MSLSSALYVGASGLQNSQNALNTTAHNLSNMDTGVYTRQQVQLSTRSYITLSIDPNAVANKQIGLGVNYSNTRQVRDFFLDKAYRKESGRSMFYEVSTEVLQEVEGQLGELNGKNFQISMEDLWTAIQELVKTPANAEVQNLFVQSASALIERAVSVYDGLAEYQDNLNSQIKTYVNTINDYGKKILALNDQIAKIECGGVESANDLRDTRNKILDELAKLTDMSYTEDATGRVSVQIEGVDFIKGEMCFEIGMDVDAATGFYTPYWPQNASYKTLADGTKKYVSGSADVFNLDREISSDYNTDIGGLKAMLHARGDHRADYTDITEGNYDDISNSILMNVQAEFDQLIHSIATTINGILADAAGYKTGTVTLEDGTVLNNVKYWESDPDGYMRSEEGYPLQLFSKISSDGYQKGTDGTGKEVWIYVEEDPTDSTTLYSLKNLQINQDLMQNPSKLGFRLADDSEDNATVNALKAAFEAEDYTLNPNVHTKMNFINYYTNLVSQVANNGYVYQSIYDNQMSTVESISYYREQVHGVSSSEELTNMIKYQNAYNASSRYINVISEMMEHIIMQMG